MQSPPPPSPAEDGNAPRDVILVAETDRAGYARVVGRGSYRVSSSLKQFASRLMDLGKPDLMVDLDECVGMDSTFMGVLAGISHRLRKENGRPIVIRGATPKIHNLMETLGLSRLVDFQDGNEAHAPDAVSELEPPETSQLRTAEEMLEAHENLVDLNEENSLRFQDVLEYLREDVNRHRG